MARKPRYTIEQIAQALEANGGILADAARAMTDAGRPISRRSLYNYIQRHPQLQEVVEDQHATLVDTAQSWLRRHVEAGDMKACIYVLNTLGKDRGFTTRTETTAANGAPLTSEPQERVQLDQFTVEELEQLEAIYSAVDARERARSAQTRTNKPH